MYKIDSVFLNPNPVDCGDSLEISVKIITWDSLNQGYTWDSLKNSGKTWDDLVEPDLNT